MPKSEVVKEAAKPSKAELRGLLKLEGVQYPNPVPGAARLNQTQSLIGALRIHRAPQDASSESVMAIVAGNNLTVGSAQFGVTELYFAKQNYAIGRKLEFWSLLDTDWQLGQWQPNYSQIDVLRPLEQGLTGIFWKQQSGAHDFVFFGTPLFIPSMGPQVKEQNGSIESDSRWYKTPSPTFNWRGVATQVVYSVDVPDIAKLVQKFGVGARYRWGASQGPWASANYGYLPINSLLLRYNTILRTPQFGPRGEVTVTPAVGYHHVGGTDVGYKFSRGMVAASILADSPETKNPEENWFQQQPQSFTAFGLHGETDFDTPILDSPLGVSVNYLKVLGGGIKDVDQTGQDMGALFASRFNFTNAATIKIESRTTLLRKKLVSSLKYLREFDQRGALFSGEFNLFPTPNWSVAVGVDVLGVENEASQDGTFLNQFRANDRYYGGLSYVF